MKIMRFSHWRIFIQVMIAIFFGVMASSCATRLSIPTITTEAQTTLSLMKEADRPYNSIKDRSLQPEDITEAMVTDYVTLIDFLIERNELRAKTLAPTVPIFTDTGKTFPRVVFFYRGRYKIERNPNGPEYVNETCSEECAKILFEGHAPSVLNVKIDPHSLEIVHSSIREFRKTEDCSQSFANPVYFRELPALGLCIEMRTPENGLRLVEEDGLHVFGDRHHLISPFAPKEFWVDSSTHLPDPGILAIAYSRSIHVMKELEHVVASADNDTQHRAIGIRSNGATIQYSMLYDYTCLSIRPELPEITVRKLIQHRAGENSLNPSSWQGDKLYYGEDAPLCQGRENDDNEGLFSDSTNGRLDFPSLFSPQEIEERLNAMMATAKRKGDDAPEWLALGKALASLQWHHPEFDADVAHRIAPILIEIAKHNDGSSNVVSYKVLSGMPHKSMEPYIDDLIWIIEDTLIEMGCEGIICPKDTRSSTMSRLAEILNGAGPKAAEYLDLIKQTNTKAYERFGYGAPRIGGTERAEDCIHNTSDCIR